MAEVYRYDGSTNWTELNATAGTFLTETSILGVPSMAVYRGKLYIGTFKTDAAEIYRYDGGTTWAEVNTTAGTLNTTATLDRIQTMTVYNNELYVGTFTASADGDAEVYRYDGGVGAAVFTARSGVGTFETTANIDQVRSMVIYNGRLIIGTGETGDAEIYSYEGGTSWDQISSTTAGSIGGGQSAFDVIPTMATYNGRLYVGSWEENTGDSKAEVWVYNGDASWTQVNTTDGTIAADTSTDVDRVEAMIAFNGNLCLSGSDVVTGTDGVEYYSYTAVEGQSFALKFGAASDATATEQTGFPNEAYISFVAEQQAFNSFDTDSQTGSFVFSHGITSSFGAYDIAEDYPTRDDTLEAGMIVSIDPEETGFIKKSEGAYSRTAVGIYSTKPGLRLSQKEALISGGHAVPVALAGRVPVKVTTEGGPIQAGDYITSSSTPGIAMKATRAGQVIGKALESFDQDGIGQIMVFVNISYADPNNVLANLSFDTNGNLILPTLGDPEDEVASLGGDPSATPQDNNVKKDLGWNLADIIRRITNLEEQMAQPSPTTSAGEATDSAELASLKLKTENLESKTASLEAELLTLNFALLTNPASSSAELGLTDLEIQSATISADLNVLGRSTLSEVGITGKISSGVLAINGLNNDGFAEINTLSGPLKLQSDGFNGVDILSGKIVIDTNGNMKVQGEITVKKLNVDTEDVASASLGTATLPAGDTTIVIETTAVTDKSKVFLTPKTKVLLPLSVTKQTAGDSFTVEVSSPTTKDVEFNW